MKGLLLKDLCMAAKYFRSYLLFIAIFLAASCISDNNMFFLFYPCLLCSMIPVNLLAYDERSKWDVYCGTLPCTKVQIVSSKYLFGLLAQMVVLICSGVTQGVKMLFSGSFLWQDYLLLIELLLILFCGSSALTLPFIFKLGVEKGRMAYYAMVVLVSGGSFLASNIFVDYLLNGQSLGGILHILSIAAIGLYILSWLLSIHFYEKRELK